MGANAGIARSDMHVLQEMACKINIVGINDHGLTGLPIVTAFMVLQTNWGLIAGIFHEYAHLGKVSSIHASGQHSILTLMNTPRLLVVNNTL